MKGKDLVSQVEDVSEQIQLLALNIAVAAAKMAHRDRLGSEFNHKLSQLVNEASQAVKQMNKILNAARAERRPRHASTDPSVVDERLIRDIEMSMQAIIADSEKITKLLSSVRRR